MLTMIRSRCSSTAVAIAILGGAAFNAAPAAADNARWGAGYFPNVTLTTQDGVEVRFYDDLMKGKIVAINLIYTICKYACPLETARLTQVAKLLGDRMGRDIYFYSISIDPEHDTPAVLKACPKSIRPGPAGCSSRARRTRSRRSAGSWDSTRAPDPSNPDGHTPMLLIGNEETAQWMRISAMDNPKFLSRTIGDWLNSWQTAKKPTRPYSDVPELKLDEGEYTFRNHCAACHTIGRGERFGPDLAGVTARRDRDWLSRFIVDPEQVRAARRSRRAGAAREIQQVVMPSLDLGAPRRDGAHRLHRQQSRAVRAPRKRRERLRPARARAGVTMKPIVDPYLRIQQALHADTLGDVTNDAGASPPKRRSSVGRRGDRGGGRRIPEGGRPRDRARGVRPLGDAIMAYAKGQARRSARRQGGVLPDGREWLQKGETIQNPFYGKAMSDCGRFNADLPGGKH